MSLCRHWALLVAPIGHPLGFPYTATMDFLYFYIISYKTVHESFHLFRYISTNFPMSDQFVGFTNLCGPQDGVNFDPMWDLDFGQQNSGLPRQSYSYSHMNVSVDFVWLWFHSSTSYVAHRPLACVRVWLQSRSP